MSEFSDERTDAIEAKLDKISDEQGGAMDALGAGITAVGGTVTSLMANLELALIAQQEAEANRAKDAAHNKQRFWVSIGGIILANILVVAVSAVLLVGQQDARELADSRSQLNRDRQSCATTLMVEWQARLGDALRETSVVPPRPPDSPEARAAIERMNQATALLNNVRELCYGPVPNPNPVPNR